MLQYFDWPIPVFIRFINKPIGINHFNQNRIWLKQLRFPNRTLFQPFLVDMRLWLDTATSRLPQLLMPRLADGDLLLWLSLKNRQELLQELVLPHCESADESEYLATCLWLFSNMFVTVSGEKPLSYQGSENRRLKRASSLLFACLFHHDDKHAWAVYACKAWKLMLANKSVGATHRFQPFQPSFGPVKKVDQPNQAKTVFSQ